MQIGVIQGRLSKPLDGAIQEFPEENWEKEFHSMNLIDLSHLEMIITPKSFHYVLGLDVRKYADKISSICCDNLMHEEIGQPGFMEDQFKPICEFALRNNIKAVTIPLLENSQLTKSNLHRVLNSMLSYSFVYHNLEFYFEMDCREDMAAGFLSSCSRFNFTYDTGNITTAGHDHQQYLETIHPWVKNVHLKDRKGLQTVEPGTGDTDFKKIFTLLKKCNYSGKFTLQTARGESGQELSHNFKHKMFFKTLYDESI